MPTLQIQLFGGFQVLVNGQPWDEFRSDKARALLAYLVVEGTTPRRRSQLTTLLWAGYDPAAARASLRVALTNLRQLPMLLASLQTTRQVVQWCTQPDVDCDVLTLVKFLAGDPAGQDDARRQALDQICQDEFLPGFEQIDSLPFQAWLQEKRAAYAQIAENLRRGLPAVDPTSAAMDWGAIPRTAHFQGRQLERTTLTHWLVAERCRLVALFGMGGQGKTALAAQWVRDQATASDLSSLGQQRFGRVLWHSLSQAPPLAEILASWLRTLSNHQVTQLPALLEDQLSLLVSYLRAQPCLLVLDSWEGILQSHGCAGCYQPRYEDYGELLRRVAASDHQSCLLITSREQPQEFHRLQTNEATARALTLRGLSCMEGQQLLETQGVQVTATQSSALVQRYSGNPLALQLAAETVIDLFAGNVADFLAQAPLIFDDLRTVLDQQFARMSPLEQQLLFGLAQVRGPHTGQALPINLERLAPAHTYLEAERSLLRRLWVEPCGEQLRLQNVILEYLADHLAAEERQKAKPPYCINPTAAGWHRGQALMMT